MLIDSHCHLASHRFAAAEVPQLIERARDAGVARLITLATSLDDLEANLALASREQVRACIGIHPCDVHAAPDDAVDHLAKHASDPRVAAIGETGLDYYHPAPDGWDEGRFRARQRDFLRQHFELAASAGLNIVLHTRDARGHASLDDALAMYRDYHRSVRAVFHCFIHPLSHAREVLALGGVLGIGGVATFKGAADVHAMVAACPAGSFMLETDSPYLAPMPHRGKRNEPAYTRATAECVAALRGESLESLAAHTTATALGFFRTGWKFP